MFAFGGMLSDDDPEPGPLRGYDCVPAWKCVILGERFLSVAPATDPR